jgi:hypothetical protein
MLQASIICAVVAMIWTSKSLEATFEKGPGRGSGSPKSGPSKLEKSEVREHNPEKTALCHF